MRVSLPNTDLPLAISTSGWTSQIISHTSLIVLVGLQCCRRHDHSFQVSDTTRLDAFKFELICMPCCIFLHRAIEDVSPHSAQIRQCSLFRRRQQFNYICFQTQRFLQDASSLLQFLMQLPGFQKVRGSMFAKSTCFWPVAQEYLNFGSDLDSGGQTDRRISLRAGRVSFASRILIG